MFEVFIPSKYDIFTAYELTYWLKDNTDFDINDDWIMIRRDNIDGTILKFKNKEDAILTKLIWG
jgi:hypothetical protein